MAPIRVAILTVSDRCARGQQRDQSGEALAEAVAAHGWAVAERATVPDEVPDIATHLRRWSQPPDAVGVILTTGGTGLTARDVTPEATRQVIEREVPGLAEAMRADSRAATPGAVLSRAVAGTRGGTLILNLPGSPGGAVACLRAVAAAVPHAVALLTMPETAAHPPADEPPARLAAAPGPDYNRPPSERRPHQ